MIARRPELDALRGFLLLTMALTHLPTRVSGYTVQPLGFVSAAEGFVFLSAFLTGSICSASLPVHGAEQVRRWLWTRALRLYGYHLALLAFAFTMAAAFAASTGRPALRNLLAFYFDSPVTAFIGGPLLIYQPPLFDILPMYIVFLAVTPLLLAAGARRGWRVVLVSSVAVWLFAQLGGRRWFYDVLLPWTGVHVPLEAGGAFDLFAWQLLWIVGVWMGVRHDSAIARMSASPHVLHAAIGVATVFMLWRHSSEASQAVLSGLFPLLDKWRLGILRLMNFAALAIIVIRLVLPALAYLQSSVLALIGRASLQVFCAHLLVCIGGLALIVDDDTPLTLPQEITLLVLMLCVMMLVAKRVATNRNLALAANRPA